MINKDPRGIFKHSSAIISAQFHFFRPMTITEDLILIDARKGLNYVCKVFIQGQTYSRVLGDWVAL